MGYDLPPPEPAIQQTLRVWVVEWKMDYEDGGFSSVWSTRELAESEAERLNAESNIGQDFSVVEVEVDNPLVDHR